TTQKTTQKIIYKIIELIKENPSITRKELGEVIGITEDGIKYHLDNMRHIGLLKRIGAKKGGHWKVVEQHVMRKQ
ncbi:winged helix-turn-helix transcriptional regulator, partial [bacterium]|nr:winged helix-turn-helix transcriptional regulator [bacterium]